MNKDTNRTRWKVKKVWDKVQKAVTEFGRLFGVLRSRRFRPKAKQLEKQARGCSTSFGALACKFLRTEDISIGKNAVFNKFMEWLNDEQFEFDMKRKLARFGEMG